MMVMGVCSSPFSSIQIVPVISAIAVQDGNTRQHRAPGWFVTGEAELRSHRCGPVPFASYQRSFAIDYCGVADSNP